MGHIPASAWLADSIPSATITRLFLLTTILLFASSAQATDWVPTDEEMQKYRQSWNPFSHGPILHTAVDLQPKGQYLLRPFIFTQVGEHSFGNRFNSVFDRKSGPVHLYSAQEPSVEFAYGLTDHIQLGATAALQSFWSRENGRTDTDTGLGDTSFALKYRPIVQDPDTWVPSLTFFQHIVAPTGKWAGTSRPPGGFAPIGRFPTTRFGEVAFTEGVMIRKNLEPFRWQAGVFYTYAAPGSSTGNTTYTGDLINTRVSFEHILNDKTGFGYGLELVTLHGLTWRADGKSINTGQRSGFSVVGVEPTIQWRFWGSNFVGAFGMLFTIAGQNSIEAVYPNLSIFYYWSQTGKVLMR
jgi:hypothetical protein